MRRGGRRGTCRTAATGAGGGPHVIPGRHPVAEALRARRRLVEIVVEDRLAGELADVRNAANAAGVAARSRPARSSTTSRAASCTRASSRSSAPSRTPPLSALAAGDLVVVLDGVTDPQNLGAIARSAEAAGAAGLVLPRRRAAGVGPAAEKAAAGAFGWLAVAQVPNVAAGLAELADLGFWSAGLAGEAGTDVWSSRLLDGKVALVVGARAWGCPASSASASTSCWPSPARPARQPQRERGRRGRAVRGRPPPHRLTPGPRFAT